MLSEIAGLSQAKKQQWSVLLAQRPAQGKVGLCKHTNGSGTKLCCHSKAALVPCDQGCPQHLSVYTSDHCIAPCVCICCWEELSEHCVPTVFAGLFHCKARASCCLIPDCSAIQGWDWATASKAACYDSSWCVLKMQSGKGNTFPALHGKKQKERGCPDLLKERQVKRVETWEKRQMTQGLVRLTGCKIKLLCVAVQFPAAASHWTTVLL